MCICTYILLYETKAATYVHLTYNYVFYCFYFLNVGFAVTCFGEEDAKYSFSIYRMVLLVAMGFSALLSLVISVKVNLIILCAMFLMFAPLHLMITCCSDPLPYVFNEVPIYFIDE